MRTIFIIVSFLLSSYILNSQIINADFEEWEEILDPNMLPYFDPVGWHTTNIPAFLQGNTSPAISVSEQIENDLLYARIESITPGIDATFSGYIEQKISIQNVKSIKYTSRCDSIELLGRCVVQLYTGDPFFAEFSDSTAVVDDSFTEKTILIDQNLFDGADSVYLRFMAFGYDFPLQPEMKGHSVFHIDNVEIDFISSTDQPINDNNQLVAYPNPSEDIINLELESEAAPRSISIYDLYGKLLEIRPYVSQINLSHLENGAYILAIETGKGVISKRVIVF